MTTPSKITVDEGTATPLATYEINEAAEDKQLSRTVLNDGDGNEITTLPVSAASLPLPTGAATAANQQTDALTDAELRAAPVDVDGSGVTQPISAASLPLPTGAATAANQQTDALTDTELRATPVPVSGTVTATTPITTEDYDTGAGTDTVATVGLLLPKSGGAVAGGTATDPLRTDPTGTTTQPVSAASLPLPTGAATATNQQTDALTDTELRATPVDVDTGLVQGLTDTELRATPVPVSGTVAATLSEPISVDDNGGSLTVDNPVISVVGGGTEATAQRVTIANDSTGVLSVDDNGGSLTVDGTVTVVGAAADGAAVAGNPVRVAGKDGGTGLTQDLVTDSSGSLYTIAQGFAGVAGSIEGQAADGAAVAGNPIRIGGKDGSGNTQDIATDTNGELQVDVLTLPSIPAGTNNIGDVDVLSLPATPAGTNLIGKVNNVPLASDGCDIFRSLDLDETEEQVKATAGTVYGWAITNRRTSTLWLKFYNATDANVTVGTTTPVLTWGIPGNSTDNVGANMLGGVGIAFSTAITVAATTGFADNDTGAPGANELIVNIFYK